MAGRRARVNRKVTSDLSKLGRKTRSNAARPQPSMSTATNAPYGFAVQGTLEAGAATFSSGVTANGSVTVTTTAGALTVPRMNTTQRNALTAAVGMIIYNTSTSKFQGYAGSSWVDLH